MKNQLSARLGQGGVGAACWMARPADDAAPSASASTPWLSIHSRARELDTSGLLIALQHLDRPVEHRPAEISHCHFHREPVAGTADVAIGTTYVAQQPMRTGFEVDWARRIAGMAIGTAASA